MINKNINDINLQYKIILDDEAQHTITLPMPDFNAILNPIDIFTFKPTQIHFDPQLLRILTIRALDNNTDFENLR